MVECRLHHLLPDAAATQLRTHDDGAEEREPVVRRRRQDAYNFARQFGREAAAGGEFEEPTEIGRGVAPVLQVRQADGGVDVPRFESPDARPFHRFTRRSSSSGSSQSW